MESNSIPTTVVRQQYTPEQLRIREQILAQYSQVELDECEDDDVPTGGGGGGGTGATTTSDPIMMKNTNASDVAQLSKERREQVGDSFFFCCCVQVCSTHDAHYCVGQIGQQSEKG